MTDIAMRTALCAMVSATLLGLQPTMFIQTDPNVAGNPTAAENWARVTIKNGSQTVAGVGASAPLWRGPIILIVDVFVSLNSGDGFAVDACEALRLAMRGFALNGLRFKQVEPGAEGPVDGWYRMQQIGEFTRTERG